MEILLTFQFQKIEMIKDRKITFSNINLNKEKSTGIMMKKLLEITKLIII